MKTIEELTKEAKEELVCENEQVAKNDVKNTLSKIVEQQKIISKATGIISELKDRLTTISIEELKI